MARKRTLNLSTCNYTLQKRKDRRIEVTAKVISFIREEFGSLVGFFQACEEAKMFPEEFCNENKLRKQLATSIKNKIDCLPNLGASRAIFNRVRDAVQEVHPKACSHYDSTQRRIRNQKLLEENLEWDYDEYNISNLFSDSEGEEIVL